jgi:hypothetical protein
MTQPAPILLDRLMPAQEQAWHTLFELAETEPTNWVLVGGQMVYLLAVENGRSPTRATVDADVVMDVRAKIRGTQWLAGWLESRGYVMDKISADGIGHRYTRAADPGPGRVIIDVLAPEGLGPKTKTITSPPARTVQAPGGAQALRRSELVSVTVTNAAGGSPRTGKVRRPTVLGALVAKAAATGIAVRTNRERDWEDAALLLTLLADPLAAAEQCGSTDRKRLRLLKRLADPNHEAWIPLDAANARNGRDALGFLAG